MPRSVILTAEHYVSRFASRMKVGNMRLEEKGGSTQTRRGDPRRVLSLQGMRSALGPRSKTTGFASGPVGITSIFSSKRENSATESFAVTVLHAKSAKSFIESNVLHVLFEQSGPLVFPTFKPSAKASGLAWPQPGRRRRFSDNCDRPIPPNRLRSV